MCSVSPTVALYSSIYRIWTRLVVSGCPEISELVFTALDRDKQIPEAKKTSASSTEN